MRIPITRERDRRKAASREQQRPQLVRFRGDARYRPQGPGFTAYYVYKELYTLSMVREPTEFRGNSREDLRAFLRRPAIPRIDKRVTIMTRKRHASGWDAIAGTPEEAQNMKLRSTLMTALQEHISRAKLNQAQAAKFFGVTQPHISNLMHGEIDPIALDTLVKMAAVAGMRAIE